MDSTCITIYNDKHEVGITVCIYMETHKTTIHILYLTVNIAVVDSGLEEDLHGVGED